MPEREGEQPVPEADPAKQAKDPRPGSSPRVFGASKPATTPAARPGAVRKPGALATPNAPAVTPKAGAGLPPIRPRLYTPAPIHGFTLSGTPATGGETAGPTLPPPGAVATTPPAGPPATATATPATPMPEERVIEPPREVVAGAGGAATEQALAGVRSWQRTIEARLEKMEAQIADNARVRAAPAAVAPPVPPARPPSQPPPPMRAPSPSVAPEAFPVIQAVPPVAQTASAIASATHVLPARTSYVDDALDADLMRALNGAKRKRTITMVAILFVFGCLAGLVTLAIVSQAMHGR